ncbi:MAG: YaiI/YqxD family protein [Desulfuromonadaceae bacterium]|nr:YaiI/YqxD family protein [Desulfuromonas sp.]MDY0185667.1 YaiI/YqxD family protein [Desulfuromonadaceae bacterium]
MLHIFIDADACPVKDEVYRVANRYGLDVTLVANSWMRIPNGQRAVLEVVGAGLDVADDWIAEQAQTGDIVITADIPLACRCLNKGARVISTTGKLFTESNIGDCVATRDLMAELREAGEITGGPPPLKKNDRSRFLQRLDEAVQAIRREYPDHSAST